MSKKTNVNLYYSRINTCNVKHCTYQFNQLFTIQKNLKN